MAARQPHEIPLPPSPAATPKPTSRKAKGKEKEYVHRESKISDEEQDWDWASLTDSAASRQKPIFSKDGSFFFTLSGSAVKIFATATGQVVSTLSSPSTSSADAPFSDTLTCAVLNPNNPFQLITGSLNGSVAVWDILDAQLLQLINVTYPIHHICAHESCENTVFVSAIRPSTSKKSGDNGVVLRVSLIPSASTVDSVNQASSSVTTIGKTRAAMGLSISPSGKWLVAIAGHKAYVSLLADLGAGFIKYVSPERLTCLAFPPSEEYFATGDDKGVIRLWYCLDETAGAPAVGVEKKAQTTTFHWHAHAVSSLAFTANGAYLLSGGEEAVLVIWQLETGKKEYVPRLGAPILTVALPPVSVNGEEYLIGLTDSTFLFVNSATLKVSRSYASIKLDPALDPTNPWTATPLAIHSATSTIILPSSHQSSLQIYSPSSHKLFMELEVSPSNRVSRREDKLVVPCRVERTAVSANGEWMATIDVREGDEDFRSETHLKIWWWNRQSGTWMLNTRVDKPHGQGFITSIAFRPPNQSGSDLWLVTTGEDGNVKTWRIRSPKSSKGELEGFWGIRSTITSKSAVPIFASWSPDGSALGISFGACVVIYDPITNTPQQEISLPECDYIVSCQFVGIGGRYLACKGLHDLVLWDTVSQKVKWHYHTRLAISWVIPHPSNGTFVAFESLASRPVTKASIFSTNSRVPTDIRKIPFALRSIAWLPSSSPADYSFVAITHLWSLIGIAQGAKAASSLPVAQGLAPSIVSPTRNIFQDIFGKSAFIYPNEQPHSLPGPIAQTSWTSKKAMEIFDAPAYLSPPVSTFYDTLMENFLQTQPVESGVGIPDVIEDEDVEMEDEPLASRVDAPAALVDQGEIQSLVALFKSHAISDNAPQLNGTPKPSANGIFRQNSTPKPQRLDTLSLKSSLAATPDGDLTDTPGKTRKRKKLD